ncbi:hypothetical protein [Solobacterium sp.]|uniref:hypothetical protein n=1 Tax=Solobacterium sp. TaxID=2060878 RepID=UPI001CB11A7F|nr:hypothetical protein [Solobacterium sp.]MBF1099610.1 hypothetical protein [Solobacterium sp.]
MVRKIVGFILSLVLGLGNLLSFTSAVNAEEAGKIWLNDSDTVTYTTINDAVAAGHTGDIIRVSGTFDTTSTAFRDAVVNNDMTLEFVGNTVILSDNSLQHGLTIASGSHIKTVNGSTLTMKGFNTALNLQVGSEMNDGFYTFENNEQVSLNGFINGSARENLVVNVTSNSFSRLYNDNFHVENATVKLNATPIRTDGVYSPSGIMPDGGIGALQMAYNFKNVHFEATGIAGFQVGRWNIEDSLFDVDFGGDNSSAGVGYIQFNYHVAAGLSTIKNTNLHLKNVLFGLSVMSDPDASPMELDIDNSVLTLDTLGTEIDSSVGDSGIQVAGGKVKVNDSVINYTRSTPYGTAFYIVDRGSQIEFTGNSVINTPASLDAVDITEDKIDNAAAVLASNDAYVVTGGSHLVKYHKDTIAEVSTTPTNGLANGNEKLTYFQLADPSVTALSPVNSNGQRYTYGVANASSDGNKYVWVPSEKVTFSLGDNPSATFADGTNTNKETLAMRGHTIGMAVRANDEAIPTFNTTPISNDASKQFKGWFYRDASGNVLPFDANTTEVLETMNVFAMWEEVPQAPVTPSQPATSVIPKTSDNTNIGYQIGVLLVSLSAVVILLKTRNLVTK